MKHKRLLVGSIIAILLTFSVVVFAQVARPYRNGSVWNVAFIRVKPGMDTAYMNYLATDWKKNQEALNYIFRNNQPKLENVRKVLTEVQSIYINLNKNQHF